MSQWLEESIIPSKDNIVLCTRVEEVNLVYNIWSKIGAYKYSWTWKRNIVSNKQYCFRISKVWHNQNLSYYSTWERIFSFRDYVKNLDLFF